MKKGELQACKDVLTFSMKLNDVVNAACRLNEENKELKAENMELKVRITALESELAQRGAK